MPSFFNEEFVHKRAQWWKEAFDEDIARVAMNITWDGLYKRTVLEPKVQQLCAVSGLTAVHALPELKGHIYLAFRAGATEAEIKEAIVQMIPFCGIPYVLEAYSTLKNVLEERSKRVRKTQEEKRPQ